MEKKPKITYVERSPEGASPATCKKCEFNKIELCDRRFGVANFGGIIFAATSTFECPLVNRACPPVGAQRTYKK